jgi:4-aminobutyrate aminotransferase-like enzyme
MTSPIVHPEEKGSNETRADMMRFEPVSLRTYTPSQAVLAQSAGVYHWTPEGKRLYDFSSGVLVANLGHNPYSWTQRFFQNMAWPVDLRVKTVPESNTGRQPAGVPAGYFSAVAMTAYNAATPIEIAASRKLIETLQKTPGGRRLEQVMWAASGSEAIQKALWTALERDESRDIILATRFGFHGKKGLADAVSGCETDHHRDPRVRFISFPMKECLDVSNRNDKFDLAPYQRELEELVSEHGKKINCLITEPYLGAGGSYHPPKEYLQFLQRFCRDHDIIFILDEVQANFGRTGSLFAFETYGIEPDLVVLGKGLGNGVPVAAAVGRKDLFAALGYGEGSDTWSANPLSCAAVLATLDEFAASNIVAECKKASAIIEAGLVRLKEYPFVANVRGEKGGMVWGLEMRDHGGKSAAEWANTLILTCYRGKSPTGDGIHILGALAKKVLRISPPLTITESEVHAAMELMDQALSTLVESAPSKKPVLSGGR